MTQNDLKQIDILIKKNLNGVATKDDLKGFATKKDLKQLATKKDLERFATKLDLQGLRKELKNDIDDAVAQVIESVDTVVGKLARRVDRIEDHLDLPPTA